MLSVFGSERRFTEDREPETYSKLFSLAVVWLLSRLLFACCGVVGVGGIIMCIKSTSSPYSVPLLEDLLEISP